LLKTTNVGFAHYGFNDWKVNIELLPCMNNKITLSLMLMLVKKQFLFVL